MDQNQPTETNILTQNQVPNQEQSPASQTKIPKDNKKNIIIIILSLLLLTLGSIFSYFYFFSNQKISVNESNTTLFQKNTDQQNNEVTKQDATVFNTVDENNQILFTKKTDPESFENLQTWLSYPDGSNQTQYPLSKFLFAFKYPSSNVIYYSKLNVPGIIYAKNIVTNEVIENKLLEHPDPNVDENIQVQSLSSIAPDGSAIVYQAWFTEPCPEITIPAGFQGGFGPCEPDLDPNFPGGYYLYNSQTKENIPIGELGYVSRWDLKNKKLYFVSMEYEKNGLYVIDLDTNIISLIDKANYFGYGAYPLFNSNFLIRNEGVTGDQPEQESFSTFSLINKDTQQSVEIDSAKWAEIQPIASLSPDEKNFIYTRGILNTDGIRMNSLYLYNIETKQLKQLTSSSDTDSYSAHQIVWIDNYSFITLLNTVEPDNYRNDNNYLVNINIETGIIKKITPNNDVARFSQL